MIQNLGVSFAPTDQNQAEARDSGALPSVQEAIRILSLRIPRRLNPRAIAPQALLQARGGSALGGNPLAALLTQLLQGGGGAHPAGAPQPWTEEYASLADLFGGLGSVPAAPPFQGPSGGGYEAPPPKITPGLPPPAEPPELPGGPFEDEQPFLHGGARFRRY
jgi:hypothetical protein